MMVPTKDALLCAHALYARSGVPSSSTGGRPPVYKVVGIILAICSGLFIGVSFVLKKMGLLKANKRYHEEAGEGYGYLKNAWWWSGMILMIIGELCNFAAYAFVDAILVTPLGALSVVITTILSAIFLKERLSFVGKVGCFNCIIGSVVIVINAPEQSAVADIQEMKDKVIAPGFLSYAGVIIVGCLIVALWAGPRYGKKTMIVYLTICSLIGGLSVVATQGLGAAIVAQANGQAQFNQWFLYVLLVFVIATLLTEIVYLNKALNIFNAALVTPTYYVFFTSATIITSAILFRGFKGTPASISTVIMGFLQICAGVVLLQLSKSAKDVPDTEVLKGDLDQVRTVAEQEESEYEPRADTIRGGGAILRSLSVPRKKKQMEEARKLKEEHMRPIVEGEIVEIDGLRRRRTVLEPGYTPPQRRKTIHPPLGMSHFPEDDDRESLGSDDMHPGFFSKFSFKKRRAPAPSTSSDPVPLSGLPPVLNADGTHSPSLSEDSAKSTEQLYGLPPGFLKDSEQDTSYKASDMHTIQWASEVEEDQPKSSGRLAPPKPPPHTARRQFSFQKVFSRNRKESGENSRSGRPLSRGALSFNSRKSSKEHSDATTEEERLGLVKGDSAHMLSLPEDTPPEYGDAEDGLQITDRLKAQPSSKHMEGARVERLPPLVEPRQRGYRRHEDYDDGDENEGDDNLRAKEIEGDVGGANRPFL